MFPTFPSARCVGKYENGRVQPRQYTLKKASYYAAHFKPIEGQTQTSSYFRRIARWGITGS